MGSEARLGSRHGESPPGAIQHAMVGKLAPEVKATGYPTAGQPTQTGKPDFQRTRSMPLLNRSMAPRSRDKLQTP